MDVTFVFVVSLFGFVHCSNEVTLSCGSNDVTWNGRPGIPGKPGKLGMKGEQGETGRCDNQDKSTHETFKLTERFNNLDRKMNDLIQNLARINSSITGVSWQGCFIEGINQMTLNGKLIDVYCEIDGEERWLIIQKRYSGEVDFYLDWESYKNGFGNLNGEFWLGLENLHTITSSGSYRLRVDLEDWNGYTKYAEYSTFSVGNSNSNYRLTIGGYSGTAGDALSYHNGQKFTTKDQDNDHTSGNCAIRYHGAWWYNRCYESNLNGKYIDGGHSGSYKGITWNMWRGSSRSMKKASMKIQPINLNTKDTL